MQSLGAHSKRQIHMLRVCGQARLRGDADRAGVGVALAHHDAAHRDQRRSGKPAEHQLTSARTPKTRVTPLRGGSQRVPRLLLQCRAEVSLTQTLSRISMVCRKPVSTGSLCSNTHHKAGNGGAPVLLRAQQRRDRQVAPGAQLAVHLQPEFCNG